MRPCSAAAIAALTHSLVRHSKPAVVMERARPTVSETARVLTSCCGTLMEDKFYLQPVEQYLNRWSRAHLNGPDVGFEVLNLNTFGFQMVKLFM